MSCVPLVCVSERGRKGRVVAAVVSVANLHLHMSWRGRQSLGTDWTLLSTRLCPLLSAECYSRWCTLLHVFHESPQVDLLPRSPFAPLWTPLGGWFLRIDPRWIRDAHWRQRLGLHPFGNALQSDVILSGRMHVANYQSTGRNLGRWSCRLSSRYPCCPQYCEMW